MIPFRHTDERVWYAARCLQAAQIPADRYEIRVDPALLSEIPRMHPGVVGRDLMVWTMFGLPLVADPRLRRGEIVLRHEVSG